jgi:hypothetical protein
MKRLKPERHHATAGPGSRRAHPGYHDGYRNMKDVGTLRFAHPTLCRGAPRREDAAQRTTFQGNTSLTVPAYR